jgi:hypothetical protein
LYHQFCSRSAHACMSRIASRRTKCLVAPHSRRGTRDVMRCVTCCVLRVRGYARACEWRRCGVFVHTTLSSQATQATAGSGDGRFRQVHDSWLAGRPRLETAAVVVVTLQVLLAKVLADSGGGRGSRRRNLPCLLHSLCFGTCLNLPCTTTGSPRDSGRHLI